MEQAVAKPCSKVRASKKKARSNVGTYMSLQAAYYGGRLSEPERERFEDLCAQLRSLYREAGA